VGWGYAVAVLATSASAASANASARRAARQGLCKLGDLRGWVLCDTMRAFRLVGFSCWLMGSPYVGTRDR
jgi:hypothetical protein